jgi:glutamate racemase
MKDDAQCIVIGSQAKQSSLAKANGLLRRPAPRNDETMHSSAPILFFDSGVGGLSVLAPTRELLQQAPIVYAADSAAYPYGTRSEAEIAARVPALLGRLVERYHPRLAAIACNTASTIALEHVRAALEIPVVGTVPAIKPAAEMSRSRIIGVLGTPATVRQPYVDDLATRFAADCTVIRHGSSELVALAEAKLAGKAIDPDAIAAAVAPLAAQPGMDVVVLACTHFPLLGEELAAALPGAKQVDGGPGIARRIRYLTQDQPWPGQPSAGTALFTGGEPPAELIPALANYGLSLIECL